MTGHSVHAHAVLSQHKWSWTLLRGRTPPLLRSGRTNCTQKSRTQSPMSIPPNDAVIYSFLSPVNLITGIQWLLNTTLLQDLNLTDVTTGFTGVVGSIEFSNPSDYNVTSVTCRAELQSGEEGSATALLLVQGICSHTLHYCTYYRYLLLIGLLSAVRSLSSIANSTLIYVTWEPPFTLDITNVDPDITGYCVDVINSTSSVTLLSECGITETEFTYLMPPESYCYSTTFSFFITPLNIVGRGEMATLFYREHLSSKISSVYNCMHHFHANLQF